ncbi:hypothetical protein AMTRI_Chr07g77790 [Amborella trichopoda]
MHIVLIVPSNMLAKNFKGKSFEYWNELSLIVGKDFVEGKDIDDDVEDVRETIVSLDNDDDVEELGDHEDFPKTLVQSRTNGMTTNPLEKSTSAMPSRKKKKTKVDTVELIGITLRKPAANPHKGEVYKALQHVNGHARPVFM